MRRAGAIDQPQFQCLHRAIATKKNPKHPVLGRGVLEAGMSANDVGSLCVTNWFIHNVNSCSDNLRVHLD